MNTDRTYPGIVRRAIALSGFLILSALIVQADPPARQVNPEGRFNWRGALVQSFNFLAIEHSARMTQSKTREEFGGRFIKDYFASVKGLKSWGDGDSVFTNYVGHPMQGAIAGYIQIHNDPGGMFLQFDNSREYWSSRLKALGWSAAYSTQFELGVLSEATIGNVGKRPGTMGAVDLVMTPTGGFGLIVLEDALDRYLIQRLESRTAGRVRRILYRSVLNPNRAFANLLRFRYPWHRDSRPGVSEF